MTPGEDGGTRSANDQLQDFRRRFAALWNGRRSLRIACLIGFALVVNLFTWPLLGLSPGSGLDGSWQIGLHMAAADGLNFGDEIGFVYGPLGFLVVPQLVTSGTAPVAFLFVFLLRIAVILAIIVACRRATRSLLLAVVVTYAIATMLVEVTEFPGLLALLAGLLFVQAPVSGRHGYLLAGALGSFVAVASLIKISGGVLALVVLGAAAYFQGDDRRKAIGSWVAGLAGSMVVLWLVTGNSLADVPRWLAWSVSTTSGYTEGTMLEDVLKDRTWEYPAYLVLASALAVFAALTFRRSGARTGTVASIVLVFALWVLFKHGFVRHDPHVVFSFVALAALFVAVRWQNDPLRLASVAGAALALVFSINAAGFNAVDTLRPGGKAGRALDQLGLVLDSESRNAKIDEARAALRAQLAIDPQIVAAIGTDGVHVAPAEVSAAWAYGFTWHPVPQFQSYTAYTAKLDGVNRRALLGSRAPRFVLRLDGSRFDFHSPVFESPGENLALLCRYRTQLVIGKWELLERGNDRCGRPRQLAVVDAVAGRPLTVPRGAQGTIVYAQVRWDQGITRRLRSLAFKPDRLFELAYPDLRNRYPFKIPSRLLETPLVLRAPEQPVSPPLRIARLLSTEHLRLEFPQKARFTFYEVPLIAG